MKSKRRYAYIIIAVVTSVIVFSQSYQHYTAGFINTAEHVQIDINDMINPVSNFIKMQTIQSNRFFQSNGLARDEKFFNYLKYDPLTDSFSLDALGGTVNEKSAGNLTGLGKIPTSGIQKIEINLALSQNEYFKEMCKINPNIAWLYYTSENNFINMYPWTSSVEFKFGKEIKKLEFYQIVLPENNPLRQAEWTPVYLDAAGKGLMVTLSSPIYNGDEFMGALSADFTTSKLEKMLAKDYTSFLIDQTDTIISTNKKIQGNTVVAKLNNGLKTSKDSTQLIRKMKSDSMQLIGTNYVYKYDFNTAPWTLVIVASVYTLIGKALVSTFPIIIICVLLFLTFREAEQRKKAEEKIKDIAITDELTGLKNRRFLDIVMESEIERAERFKAQLSIIIFDLDHFKKVNDAFGHPIGDEVLKQTAVIAQGVIRKADTLVRIGGEEFLVLLPETNAVGAVEIAEKIRKALETREHPIAGKCMASFGVAERMEGDAYLNLYKKADEALYLAKGSGRNRVVNYEAKADKPIASVHLEWNNKWSSGDNVIDQQHRELLEIANNLMTLSFSGAPNEKIKLQLDLMMKTILKHFKDEEQIQENIGYPGAARHAEIHEALVRKALKIKEDYQHGLVNPSAFFSFLLDDVLVAHMVEEDSKFFPYIKKQITT